MGNKIVIIDGNSLVNRAYYAMQRPMITKEGIYTQGIYGFVNMLNKIMTDYEPEYMAVAFDLKAPTFRHLKYDQYKAGRKPMPMELVMQMPILKELLNIMNIKVLELEGYEADDIIGTIARFGEENSLEPIIITGDKDALQLASDKTKVLITKKGITEFQIFDHEEMINTYGLTPSQFIDLKGLMGDSSDNIPGVPGIGEKTGISLLLQFETLENLLENTDQIQKNGVRKKIEENVQLARLSKELATINCNVPIEFSLEEMKVCQPDYARLIELYKKLEFNSFLKKLSLPKEQNEQEREKFDLEWKGKRIKASNLEELKNICMSLKDRDNYIKSFGSMSHIDKPYTDYITLVNEEFALLIDCTSIGIDKVMELLNDLNLNIYGHNIKDELYALKYCGLKQFNVKFDTSICEYVLDPTRNNYQLEEVVFKRLGFNLNENDDNKKEQLQIDMFEDKTSDYLEKSINLFGLVSNLLKIQKNELEKEQLEKVFYEAELPLIEVLADMEIEGMNADLDFLNEFGMMLKEKILKAEEEIFDLAGKTFNINSPIQLGEVLFEDLKLPAGKKTKRGYSTSAEILEKIKDKHPIVNIILKYRNLAKLNSTYVEGMKPLICSDGKIRAHFQQSVTATGRISCTEPNLQNIPIRQELGRHLRKAFKASDENHILVGADYSQIELRVLAHLSGDEALINAFNKGEDIHRATASKVLGIEPDKVTANDRSKAKAVNFGVIYGMSGFGLSEELSISRKEAEKYIEDYFAAHTKVKEYMDLQISNCREKGYSLTILGRKRPIKEITASAYMVRQLGERLAMNSPIQGSAADIIKLAMVKVHRELKEKNYNSKLILQVHDELIIDACKDELEAVKELLVRNMEEAMDLCVNLSCELNVGNTWFDLK